MTTDYRVEYPPPDDWSTYETLIAPDGAEIATLTEPEDRTWGRDLRPAVDHMRDLVRRLASAEERARRAEQAKDGAYRERDQIVALLARMAVAIGWRAGLRRHESDPDPTWDEDWKNVVAIDLPTGQVTWHFHDSERDLFHSLPPYPAPWDGHDTPEKYRRVNSYLQRPPPAATETREGASHE